MASHIVHQKARPGCGDLPPTRSVPFAAAAAVPFTQASAMYHSKLTPGQKVWSTRTNIVGCRFRDLPRAALSLPFALPLAPFFPFAFPVCLAFALPFPLAPAAFAVAPLPFPAPSWAPFAPRMLAMHG